MFQCRITVGADEFFGRQEDHERSVRGVMDFQRPNIGRIVQLDVPETQGTILRDAASEFRCTHVDFRRTFPGPQHRAVPGQTFVVHEHAHQTGRVRRRLRTRRNRQPRLPGRLFQLLHTENAPGRQRRRNRLVLRFVSARQHVVGPREYSDARDARSFAVVYLG